MCGGSNSVPRVIQIPINFYRDPINNTIVYEVCTNLPELVQKFQALK